MKPQTSNLLRTVFCPLLAAFLWGSTFVAQDIAAETVPPFTFNAMRSWVGALFLYIISLYISKRSPVPAEHRPRYRRDLLIGGLCCGLMLAIASNLQQFGMGDTDAGKAGFITSLYVVLVPIFGLFCNRRAPLTVWVSIGVALVGLYLLCITDTLTIALSDGVILLCAVFFALQILFLDRVPDVAQPVSVHAFPDAFPEAFFRHPDQADFGVIPDQLLQRGSSLQPEYSDDRRVLI